MQGYISNHFIPCRYHSLCGIFICKKNRKENKQMPKIVFNENFGVDEITILLERRDFHKYGKQL